MKVLKSKGFWIAAAMVAGLAFIGIGLDWDQSQIAWRGRASTGMWITGGILFLGAFGYLCTLTSDK